VGRFLRVQLPGQKVLVDLPDERIALRQHRRLVVPPLQRRRVVATRRRPRHERVSAGLEVAGAQLTGCDALDRGADVLQADVDIFGRHIGEIARGRRDGEEAQVGLEDAGRVVEEGQVVAEGHAGGGGGETA